jgi:hypothetical protein
MHRTTTPSYSALPRQGALSRLRFWRVAAVTVVVLAGAGLFFPSSARAQEAKHIHSTNGFLDFPAKTVARPGYSVLIRTEDDISLRVHAIELIAGHVYTFWIGVTDPDGSKYGGRVDSRVVDASGIVNLRVEVEVGEIVGDFHPTEAPPLAEGQLRNPMTSTITMVIRDHGPASSDPADLYQQMYTHQTYNTAASDFGITTHAPPAP